MKQRMTAGNENQVGRRERGREQRARKTVDAFVSGKYY